MKLSLILMCWNTAYLLGRTLETLQKQTLDDWELIIVDDNSEDDVLQVLARHGAGLPIQYHRLEHDFGMRGNTYSINYGVEQAQGYVVMWSTPEVMLPSGALEAAFDAHASALGELLWVTIPSHGLTAEMQLQIDLVDWRKDIHNIKRAGVDLPLDSFASKWFWLNFYECGRQDWSKKKEYSNNQTVAVVRQAWLDTVGSFPLFMDYGSDDPWAGGARRKHSFKVVTLWEQEAYHQWHPFAQFWMAQGKAPNWNRRGHTTSNLMNDPRVPEGGTCEIWDEGDRSPLTEAEKAHEYEVVAPLVAAVGYRARRE